MVKIRLARRGRKKLALYDVVIADARAPRDGRFIEKIGTYNPNIDPAVVNIDADKAFEWVMKGAQPTDTVRAMLSYKGVMLRKHLQIGVNKGAITQEEADKRLAEWLKSKEDKIEAKRDKLAKDLESSKKARLEAEAKIKDARAEAIAAKNKVEEEVVEEETTEEAPVAETEAAPAEEATIEEAPVAETEAAPAEEAPAAEVEETPAEEVEAPAAEATEEPKAEEAKEEASEEDKKED